MNIDKSFPSGQSDKEIKKKIKEWSEAMFSHTDKGADINAVMLYMPLIQLGQNELSSRFIKRSTITILMIAVLSLGISLTALLISLN